MEILSYVIPIVALLFGAYLLVQVIIEIFKVVISRPIVVFIPDPPDSDDPPTLPLPHLAKAKAGAINADK